MKPLKGIVAAAIALSTFAGMSGVAYADDNSTAPSTTSNTVTTDNNTVTGDNNVTTDTNTIADNGAATDNGTSTNNTVSPSTDGTTTDVNSASPDSYLYFVQQVTQAISVSLASSDLQKAELLAQYGQQQIEAANTLLQSGTADATATSATLLTDALNNQLLAVDSANAAAQTGTVSTAEVSSVKGVIGGNITALATALQHVSNPQAQASLEKNVAKAFSHLQTRLAHIGKESSQDIPLSAVTADSTDATAAATGDANQTDTTATTTSKTPTTQETTQTTSSSRTQAASKGHASASHGKANANSNASGILNTVTSTTNSVTENSVVTNDTDATDTDATNTTTASTEGKSGAEHGQSQASTHASGNASNGQGHGKH